MGGFECGLAIAVVCTGLISLISLTGCNDKAAPPPAQPRFVLTETVQTGASLAAERLPGEVRARQETPLAFRVGGKLVQRKAEVGDTVRAGQVLAELDTGDLRHNQQGIEAELAAAEADWHLAQAEVARYRRLQASQFVSQAALEAKETLLKVATEKRAALQSRLATARNQTGYAALKADAAGIVAAVHAEPGQVVSAGQPVLTLAQAGAFEIVVQVPEARIAAFKVGQAAQATLWAVPQHTWPVQVREVAPQADPVTRTWRVRLAFADGATTAALRLGMSAEVALQAPAANGRVLLPATAIFQSGRQPAVWVIVEGKVQLRPVEVVRWGEDSVEVRSGLKNGETLVRAGVNKLVAGEAVTPLPR